MSKLSEADGCPRVSPEASPHEIPDSDLFISIGYEPELGTSPSIGEKLLDYMRYFPSRIIFSLTNDQYFDSLNTIYQYNLELNIKLNNVIKIVPSTKRSYLRRSTVQFMKACDPALVNLSAKMARRGYYYLGLLVLSQREDIRQIAKVKDPELDKLELQLRSVGLSFGMTDPTYHRDIPKP